MYMSKIKFLVFVSFFILAIGLVNAQESFNVQVTAIKDKIVVDEVAEFDITITNNMASSEEFTIKKAGYPFWDTYTQPLQNPITLVVPGNSSESIRIFIDPQYITSVDTYTLDFGIEHQRTGYELKVPITIGIKSTAPLITGYVPTVTTSISIPENIDPRREFTIKIVLNNQNPIDYDDLVIKVESSLFTEELHTTLVPREDKTLELTKKLPDTTIPQHDRLIVSVLFEDRVIVNPIIHDFNIVSYSEITELPKEQSFLKIKKGFKVISNDPNFIGTVKTQTSGFENLFTSTDPNAETIKENGKYYIIWKVEVGRERAEEVYMTVNYRILVIIILFIIASIILYFLFRSPLILTKSVASVGTSEGGISDAKVVVKIKNRSSEQITDIEVMDNLPHIAHVEKDLSIGSIQPHAVLKHPKRGMVIKWVVDALESGDERVLSYKMKSRLPILGEFNLPAASARAKFGNKVVITSSNRVSIGAH